MQGIVGGGNQRWWKVQITQVEWKRTAMLPTARVLTINNSIRPPWMRWRRAGNAAVRNEQQMCVSLQPAARPARSTQVVVSRPWASEARRQGHLTSVQSSCPQRFIPHCGRWMDGWMGCGWRTEVYATHRLRKDPCTRVYILYISTQ